MHTPSAVPSRSQAVPSTQVVTAAVTPLHVDDAIGGGRAAAADTIGAGTARPNDLCDEQRREPDDGNETHAYPPRDENIPEGRHGVNVPPG